MQDLINQAAAMGVEVHAAHLEGDVLGLYSADEKRIYVDLRLTPAERRSVLAHELGHVYFGHTGDSPANERIADRFAARTLIDPHTYAQLEALGLCTADIADELVVTEGVIYDYRTYCLSRLGEITYQRSHMGRGQWMFRGA